MSKAQSRRGSGFVRAVKKLLVSSFVVFTFVAYAIHDRLSGSEATVAADPPLPPDTSQVTEAAAVAMVPSPTDVPTQVQLPPTVVTAAPRTTARAATVVPSPTDIPSPTDVPPTDVPPTAVRRSGLQDGQYTGSVADAFFGNVQVKAIIQSGRISDVQFLQYPQDRRTSARINSWAVPALRTEALRAQSAQVDIISGATLTSEAFMQSLQVALNKAKA